MTRVLSRRTFAAAIITLAATVPLAPAAQAAPVRITPAYELPGARVYPEGIATDPYTGDLFAGSFTDGTIFRTRPGGRVAEKFLPAGADGRDTANGLKVDRARRLWVTDSNSGVSVYDIRSRRLLARFYVPGQRARFVNDLALTPDGTAYLTDSRRAVVYRVTPRQLAQGGQGNLKPAFDLSGVLEPHAPDAYTLNGIVADPAGRHLLIADMAGGDLYRIGLGSGRISKVALSGGDMLYADGLELQHGRLWVVHNVPNAISRWRVAGSGLTARQERRVADKALQLPTTLVRRRGTLYVVRSQFDKGGPMGPGTPQIPFTIASVRGI